MKNKVTLYVAQHSVTGLKYFGKTTKYFTEECLQDKYHGSGTEWKRHLKENGDIVKMAVYGIYSLDPEDENYVVPVALKFSEDNDIVKDNYNWANKKLENGLDGGLLYGELNGMYGKHHSEETKSKISVANKNPSKERRVKIGSGKRGKKASKETKLKLSKARKGEKHHMYGKHHTCTTKRKLSEAQKGINSVMFGKPKSEETKERMRKPKEVVSCPHCDKLGGIGIMKRWHFDNCKLKVD